MRRFLALALALVMVLSLSAVGAKADDVTHIKLEMATLMTVPSLEATKTVENVINDYLANTLGITDYVLDLTIIPIADLFTIVPMELAGGSGPDLVMLFDNMPSFVDQGYLIPLDDFLDNELKPTADKIGNIMNNGRLGGSVYMIPRYFGTVLDWKFIYNNDLVEGKYDMSKVHDMDSLEECLAALKEAYPDEHFLVYTDQFYVMQNFATHTAQVGLYAATEGDSTTLVNYYATDAYHDACRRAYEFRQKGYCDPEGSANTLSHDEAVMSGSSKGVIMGHSADAAAIGDMFDKMNYYGADFEAVTIGISDLTNDGCGIGISYSCKNPSAAASFINLLYCDEFVWDTLIYGAEGQDYVWNEGHTVCDYPEGLDANTIPYNCMYSCGIIGNGFQGLPFANSNTGSNSEYGMELMNKAWAPPMYGFTPSNVNVMNEYAAVTNVVSQYEDVLNFGDVDPDSGVYEQFLSDLESAGINAIIADYQAQADEWLAANK